MEAARFSPPNSTSTASLTTDSWRVGIRGYGFFLILLMAGLLFFLRLRLPLLEPEETRYAEIARQMLTGGEWLIPHWHGEVYLHKPPLFYWLLMAAYSCLGVADGVARLAASLGGFGIVVLTYLWARRGLGRGAALWATVLLLLSPRFVYQARMVTPDGWLCFWVIAALWSGQTSLSAERRRCVWWTLSACACGLGMLTKGPVALCLVLPPLWLWGRFGRGAAAAGWRSWLWYGLISVGVAGPWYLAVAGCEPAAAGAFFWLHNIVRYVDAFDHVKPVWYFAPLLMFGMLPWSLLLLPVARRWWRRATRPSAAQRTWLRRRLKSVHLFWLAGAWCLLFFSLADCKRPGYILPCCPLLAVGVGTYLARLVRLQSWTSCSSGCDSAAFLWLTLVLALGAGLTAAASGLWSWTGALIGGSLLGVCGIVMARKKLPPRRVWIASASVVFTVLVVGIVEVLPQYHRRFGMRGVVRRQATDAGDARIAVACFPRRWDSVSFYLQRDDVQALGQGDYGNWMEQLGGRDKTLVFVKGERWAAEFVRLLPATLEFVPVCRHHAVTSGYVRRR